MLRRRSRGLLTLEPFDADTGRNESGSGRRSQLHHTGQRYDLAMPRGHELHWLTKNGIVVRSDSGKGAVTNLAQGRPTTKLRGSGLSR